MHTQPKKPKPISFLSNAAPPPHHSKNNTLIVCLGGLGLNSLKRLTPIDQSNLVLVDTNPANFVEKAFKHPILLSENSLKTNIPDEDKGKKQSLFTNVGSLIFFCNLGGKTRKNIFFRRMNQVDSIRIPYKIVLAISASFEGNDKRDHAFQAIKLVELMTPEMTSTDYDRTLQSLTETLLEAFQNARRNNFQGRPPLEKPRRWVA